MQRSPSVFPLLALCAPIFLLTACGSDESTNSDSDNSTPPSSYVTGTFKSVTETSKPISGASGGYGCRNATRYFESDDVLVYGSSDSLPDDDYKYAATLVQNNLGKMHDAIGFKKAEFNAMKPAFTPEAFDSIMFWLDTAFEKQPSDWDLLIPKTASIILSHAPEGMAPEDIANMDDFDFEILINGIWPRASRDEQRAAAYELMNLYPDFDFYNPDSRDELPEHKVYACLDESFGGVQWGQGTLAGIDIAPRSVAPRDDASKIVLHELIHHAQSVITAPTRGGNSFERWMSEGQAVALSGMATTSGDSGFNPVDVYDFTVESSVYSDLGLAYRDYGQAYEFIQKNFGVDAIKQLMLDIRYDTTTYREVNMDAGDRAGRELFYKSFDATFTERNGMPFSLDYFRADYPSLRTEK